MGVSFGEADLPLAYFEKLKLAHPGCFFRGRFIAVYKGLAMGASPSVKQLDEVLQAMLGAWDTCPVRGATFTRSLYVDDSCFAVKGTFAAALELSLRVLAEMIMLGFSVNLKLGKSQITPAHCMTHLGFVADTVNQRFSLSKKRVASLGESLTALQESAKKGGATGLGAGSASCICDRKNLEHSRRRS